MAAKYGGGIVRKGLIINCDAGNPKSYPGTGTNWYNLAAPQFDTSDRAKGILTSASMYQAGPPASMQFSSASSHLVSFGLGSDYFTNTTGQQAFNPHEWTFEVWYKSSGLGGGMTLGGLIGFTYGIRCYINSSQNIVYCFDNGSNLSGTSLGNGNSFDGNWHHVVITARNAGNSGYHDGELLATTTRRWQGKTRWLTNQCYLGRDNNDIYYYLNGNIAIFRVYKKFFSDKDVKQNFNALRGRFGV